MQDLEFSNDLESSTAFVACGSVPSDSGGPRFDHLGSAPAPGANERLREEHEWQLTQWINDFVDENLEASRAERASRIALDRESRFEPLTCILQSGVDAAVWVIEDARLTAAFLICGARRAIERTAQEGRAGRPGLVSGLAGLFNAVVGPSLAASPQGSGNGMR